MARENLKPPRLCPRETRWLCTRDLEHRELQLSRILFPHRQARENEILHAPSRMLSYMYVCVCVYVYICVRMIPLKTSRAASHARTSCAYAFASRNSYIRSFKSFERSLSEKKKKKKKLALPSHHMKIGYNTSAFS